MTTVEDPSVIDRWRPRAVADADREKFARTVSNASATAFSWNGWRRSFGRSGGRYCPGVPSRTTAVCSDGEVRHAFRMGRIGAQRQHLLFEEGGGFEGDPLEADQQGPTLAGHDANSLRVGGGPLHLPGNLGRRGGVEDADAEASDHLGHRSRGRARQRLG